MHSFSGAPGASGVSLSAYRMQQQNHLELAGRMVDRQLQTDNQWPPLISQLKLTPQGAADVSGLHDNDYPDLSTVGPGLDSLSNIAEVKKTPLPAELVEQFAHMQCNCMMGLFPVIGRAWLTIDSNIFVWTYEDNGDLAYFDGLSETIFGVGLVKPKAGIFQSHIRYLLCLTTPVEIVLLGVSFNKLFTDVSPDHMLKDMNLMPEPLFSLPSDHTCMTKIVGTQIGRIFMGGKDGCLYEMVYQAEEGWFSRKCRKINHSSSSLSFLVPSFLNFAFSEEDAIAQIEVDNSRNILYTRSEKGTITIYDLGIDGCSTDRVAVVPQTAIVQHSLQAARTIDQSVIRPIVHISPVERSDSPHVHLVAVTHAGVRLYFTTSNLNNPLGRPSFLQLLHVRLPTGFSAVSPPQRPSKVHSVNYGKGTLLMTSSQSDDTDILWCLSNDSFAFQAHLMETQTSRQIDGKTWALDEVPQEMVVVQSATTNPPLLITQHRDLPRKFVLLSAQGCHVITKLRPVDQLRHLLLRCNGPDCDAVRSFFLLHREQACVMCFILACSMAMQDKQIVDWATRALFLYGSEPQLRLPSLYAGGMQQDGLASPARVGVQSQNWGTQSSMNLSPYAGSPSNFHPPQVSTPNLSYQGSPLSHTQQPQQQSMYTGSPVAPQVGGARGLSSMITTLPDPQAGGATFQGPDIQFSGRHDGLYLYFSRIVRPLWDEQATVDVSRKGSKGVEYFINSTVSGEELSFYIEQLAGLKDFLFRHSSAILPLESENLSATQNFSQRLNSLLPSNDPNALRQQQQLQKKLSVEAQLQEKSSIYNLQQLIDRTIEMLGLWKILCDHQFHVVSGGLPKDYQDQLRRMLFKDLFINGKQMASILIACVINRYLGDNATIDAIIQRLREVCPTVYRAEDATFSKANELLIQSHKVKNKQEKEALLKQAIQLCKQVVPQVNMPMICQQLQAIQHYDGIVELCLLAASRRDDQNLALYFYRNGELPEDQQGFHAFSNRMECYKFITDTLSQLLVASTNQPHSSSIPRSPGPPSSPDSSLIGHSEARDQFERVLSLCLKSDDEMFHIALYNWLVDQKLEDRILDLQSPYIEDYLKRAVNHYADNLPVLDLLWKFYQKNNNFNAAAKILAKLADRHGNDIPLRKRLEYLSRSIMCLKGDEGHLGSRSEGELLNELEEKMEVARIQLQILEAVSQLNTRGAQDAVSQLNADLLNITQLYEGFAYPLNLHECQLAVLHCASLHDSALVESLWQNIINKELDEKADNIEASVLTLSNKLKSLGKIYMSSQNYFPLAFLIKYLETKSVVLNLESKWVYSIFLAIGISLSRILEAYNKFYKSKDPQWLSLKRVLHLLQVLSKIVSLFVESPGIVPTSERRQFTTTCLDAVASYQVDLQSLEGSDPAVRVIVDSFHSTQIRLERML